jgi:parallel beta-helix repeat protein
MIKNGITIGIVLFLLVGSFASGITINLNGPVQQSSRGNTLYVGGGGSGNYTTIQSAINDANNGDIIFVYSGIYYENVIINKTVDLIGENKYVTFIDGNNSDDVVYISVDYVNISGFTIQHSGHQSWDCGVNINSKFAYLSNNIIDSNTYGIGLYKNDGNNIINNNIISNNSERGIDIFFSDYNEVNNNIIKNNKIGLRIYFGKNLIILNNLFENCGISFNGYTIPYWITHTIENNTINGKPIRYYKNASGITVPVFTGQVLLANCKNFLIKDLYLSGLGENITLGYSSNNFIVNNIISNNNQNGIGLIFSDDNTIHNNSINNNSIGVYLHLSKNNIIYHNNFINNFQNVYFFADVSYPNTWNDSYPSCGNYWDDYTGIDNYKGINQDIPGSDGIGDTPYPIAGVANQDFYPFIEKNGWINQPPGITIINGPSSGTTGHIYSYTFVSVDPDDDDVFYQINWGDGTVEGWIGPFDSNEIYISEYAWAEQGNYTIMARAKDDFNVIGDWGMFLVNMPRNRGINTPFINWLQSHPNMFPILQLLLHRFGLQ